MCSSGGSYFYYYYNEAGPERERALPKVTLQRRGMSFLRHRRHGSRHPEETASGREGALFQDRLSGNGSAEKGRQPKQEGGKNKHLRLVPVGARLRTAAEQEGQEQAETCRAGVGCRGVGNSRRAQQLQ